MISIVNGPLYPVMGLAEWKTLARAGRAPEKVTLRKSAGGEPIAPAEDRTMRFTISSGSVDRDRDAINPDGWKLDNYLKNPVVLWAHSYDTLPVAKAIGTWVEGERLLASAEFPPPGKYPFADTVLDLLRGGFLNATSVGFAPIKHVYNEERGGIDFHEQELLEFSVVSVPANPEALVEASKKSFDRDGVLKWLNGSAPARPVSKAGREDLIEVDAVWLDRTIRAIMSEQIAAEIRKAVCPAVRSAVMMLTGRVD